MIVNLTPEQELSIKLYKEKWKGITLSTQRLNREKILTLLETTHCFYPCGVTPPEVIFFDSPFAAFRNELKNAVSDSCILCEEGLLRDDLWSEIHSGLHFQIDWKVWQKLGYELEDEVGSRIYEKVWNFVKNWFFENLTSELSNNDELLCNVLNNFLASDSEWALYAGVFDFCFNELNCQYDEEAWKHYLEMVRECGWWFLPTPFHYVVCDRPIKILFDENEQLHAEGETAIQYSDGFGLYANHGEITSAIYP